MKKILVIIAFIFIFSLTQNVVYAKTLPQAKTSKTTPLKTRSASINVTPKLRGDRHALTIYFSNLQNAESVSYMLVYKTNGQAEGAGGSVNPSQGNNASRELLFGTCSKNVCRYHPNITNMSLEVTAQLTSGKKLTKHYKIKI